MGPQKWKLGGWRTRSVRIGKSVGKTTALSLFDDTPFWTSRGNSITASFHPSFSSMRARSEMKANGYARQSISGGDGSIGDFVPFRS